MKLTHKKDIVIIFIIIIIAVAFYGIRLRFFRHGNAIAEIYYENKLVTTVELDKNEDRIFSIQQNEHVIFHLYKDGSICFEESDCPDKVCIRSGRLSRVGETAACLPNKIILKIVSDGNPKKDDIDIIVQ